MGERKKILIIGEAMLDKTITVSFTDNKRSYTTYKKKRAPKFTFGGVFYISRYLQHCQDVDIKVLNVNPKLTKEISEKYADFTEKFEEFTENDMNNLSSECVDLRGSSNYIHSITRFMIEEDKLICFQIEDYYVPNNRCKSEDKKRYTYSNIKKRKLWDELKSEIESWIEDNQNFDRRILLMDYDLGLFEEEGLLNELKDCFNKLNDPIIIYSGRDYAKFNSFQNAHVVTYSEDAFGEKIRLKKDFNNIKNYRSLILVSANYTEIYVIPSTKEIRDMKDPRKVVTDAWDCSLSNHKNKPRIGHKAIIAAHLAMALTPDVNSIFNETSWLNSAHICSRAIAGKLLTNDFFKFDLNELLNGQNPHEIPDAQY